MQAALHKCCLLGRNMPSGRALQAAVRCSGPRLSALLLSAESSSHRRQVPGVHIRSLSTHTLSPSSALAVHPIGVGAVAVGRGWQQPCLEAHLGVGIGSEP